MYTCNSLVAIEMLTKLVERKLSTSRDLNSGLQLQWLSGKSVCIASRRPEFESRLVLKFSSFFNVHMYMYFSKVVYYWNIVTHTEGACAD